MFSREADHCIRFVRSAGIDLQQSGGRFAAEAAAEPAAVKSSAKKGPADGAKKGPAAAPAASTNKAQAVARKAPAKKR